MAKDFHEVFQALGAKYIGQLPHVTGGAFGAAHLAHVLQERLQPGQASPPDRPAHQPVLLMTEETVKNLDILVERINQHSSRKVNRTQVAAVLLDDAIARELAQGA